MFKDGQLHSSPMLVRLRSKSSEQGFSITWTKNFQVFKLGLEKAEEPEIKLPAFTGSQRKHGNPRKSSSSVSFFGLQNHCRWWLQPWNQNMLTPWKESYDQPRQHIKKQRHYFANKSPSSQGYCFSSSHVWTLELDYKESWAPKNWCFWTVVLEKILESPLDCRETQPVLGVDWKDWCWSWNSNNLATWCEKLTHLKRPWCWKRLRAGEGDDRDEMAGWHHQLNAHGFG